MHTAIVPGGCISIFKLPMSYGMCFKSHEGALNEWLADPTKHKFTKGGNLKAPLCELICEWRELSWDAFSEDMMKKSFLSCAITAPTDGSNDSAIHCFKEHLPCAQGKDLLKKKWKSC